MGLLILVVIPFRFLTGWAYDRTGNLFLVGLVHGMGNAVAGGSGYGSGGLPRLYPDQGLLVGVMHLLAFAVIGLVVLAVSRAQLGLDRGQQPAPAGDETTGMHRPLAGDRYALAALL